jgi:hypothetical protein
MNEFTAVIDALKKLGVTSVVVGFDGSGDDGESYFSSADGHVPDDIQNELVALISDVIPFDWYNNEGGYGTATLDVNAGKVDIDGYSREVSAVANPSTHQVV